MIRNSVAAIFALAVLAGCGGEPALVERRADNGIVEVRGMVLSVNEANSLITVGEEGASREINVREEAAIVDTSGARRTLSALQGMRVLAQCEVAPGGRYFAERITVLPADPDEQPTIIEPPQQD